MSNTKQLREIRAGEIMMPPLMHVMTEPPVKEIAVAILKVGVSADSVPVIEQACRLVGIVSRADLPRALARMSATGSAAR